MEYHSSLKILMTAAAAGLLLCGCQGSTALADRPSTAELPAGTAVVIRLDEGISTAKNTSGEEFHAHLSRDVERDGKVLVPKGTEAVGKLVHVEEPGRVKGRAEMTLTLTKLKINDRDYLLETNPITIEAQSTEKTDTGVIAGTSAVGAIIGAIAGGGKGAAIGAGAGAAAGTGAVLSTKGKQVEFGPETRFEFRLRAPVEVPVVTSD